MGEERGRSVVGIDAEVCKQRMERSMTDQNGCPGMHVLVSIPPIVMLTDPPPFPVRSGAPLALSAHFVD
jgi:hypothetical protein